MSDDSKNIFKKHFIQIADKNNDGKLSFEEFKKICWECLGLDENEDGK